MTARRLLLASILCGLLLPAGLFFALDRLFPFPWAALERPPATVVVDLMGDPLRFFLPRDETWRFPLERRQLPEELVRAVVAAEDRFFYLHPGVNPAAVLRAAWANLRAGRVVSGASTLPMQIARMVDPAPRTLAAKLRESFRALQLDAHLDKEEILKLYLNLAPYGSNIEGVGAAAWFYFGKEPAQLALGEIALLAVLPRSPAGYDPTRHPRRAQAARLALLARLERDGVFTAAQIEAARRHPIPTARLSPPWRAPHFGEAVRGLGVGSGRIATTLDRELQGTVERLVGRRIGALRSAGVGNAAAVVIDIGGREVRALVGSGGYFESNYDGQVNGALARRSPGSTLKPFLYGLALDSGEVLPDSYLLDIPTDYSGYVAQNYDGLYRGRVTARSALVQSLNAPAVRLLSAIGLEPFHRLLVRGGLSTLDRPAAEYGLPLVLGAGEVTLVDLTNLFATLAAEGLHRPLRWLAPAPGRGAAEGAGRGERLLSREAAWVITEILSQVQRPDLPQAWDLTRGAPGVAWKTGTSYGHRDAWAVGFSRRYAVGVWVGNFDGTPRQGISGSEHAAPLLFEIFRAIEPGGVAPGRPEGLRLGEIELCALSRELPGPFCRETRRFTDLPGRSRLESCSLHRRVPVDRESGGLLTADCASRPFRWQELLVYPAELVAWQRAQGEAVPAPPPVAPACGGGQAGEPPRIVSPDPSTPYRLRREAPLSYQRIALVARPAADARRLYWYQDGLLVGSAAAGESLFLTPSRGRHRIAVTDDLGRSDGLTYLVE